MKDAEKEGDIFSFCFSKIENSNSILPDII